jgi:uncharacterized protein
MSEQPRLYPYAVPIAVGVGLFMPTLSLVPLGSVWLWQNGYLLYWALISAGFVAIAYLLQRRLLRLRGGPTPVASKSEIGNWPEPINATWTPTEEVAWADVLAIARLVDVQALNSQDAFLALGGETIRAVAKRLHPEVADPLWQFTVPEAFAIIEQVSGRLGAFTVENIPLSDRLTVAQALSVYRWRGAVGVAEKAFDLWRLVRLANPLTAATHELRERLSKQMMQWGKDHVTKRLAHAYVTEIGRAAIDLYGGRLKIRSSGKTIDLASAAPTDSATDPIRILIAGQPGAGKSSLLNALANEVHAAVDILPTTEGFVAHELRPSGFPNALVIDSPGLTNSDIDSERLAQHAMRCDLLLWIAPAHRADREIDRTALSAIRTAFAARVDRHVPPMLLIVSHIDKLRPFGEWLPPYDLVAADRPKSKAIRDAIEQIGGDLGFRVDQVVAVNLASVRPYNIDSVWARVMLALPDAQSAQLVRKLRDGTSDWDWPRILRQAAAAGRVLGRTLTSKK